MLQLVTLNDGTRFVAQLFVWNPSTLALERSTGWFWGSDTTVSSVAIANITGGLGLDIVTGGAFFDGTRWIAQLIVWNGVSLTAEKLTTWFWSGDTQISSVAVANVTGGTTLDIVTGGAFFDGTRWVAQLIVWNSATMAADKAYFLVLDWGYSDLFCCCCKRYGWSHSGYCYWGVFL